MCKYPLIRIDPKTYAKLKLMSYNSDVPMSKIVKKHILGKPAKVKKLGDY